jgi:hypothetical protein
MKMIFSERNKIVCGKAPVADCYAAANNLTDVVSLKNYRYATFLIMTGASVNNTSVFSVVAGTSVDGAVNQTVPFKYRKCESGDTFGALTDVAAGSTVALTASKANEMIVIEVDAQEVETAHPGHDCIGLKVANGSATAAQFGAVAVIMSGARYADDKQPSAIID